MIEKFFTAYLSRILIGVVLILVAACGALYVQYKTDHSALQITKGKLETAQAENLTLANQIENARLQIEQYQAQTKALQENVLEKMQQAEERNNEILSELENHKNWSRQPVPDNVSRLLNHRADQSGETAPATLPKRAPLPSPDPQHQNQRGFSAGDRETF